MTECKEWSVEFDLLYNNIASDKAPGLDEYEKSVFLTRAQESVVVALYNGSLGDAFESTEAITEALASLIKQEEIAPEADVPVAVLDKSKSYIFETPYDLLFRTLELCELDGGECDGKRYPVIPVTQDEYWRTVRNPFKRQNKRRVLRIASAALNAPSGSGSGSYAGHSNEFPEELQYYPYTELISDVPVKLYCLRYIAKPEPIILPTDLASRNLSINGKNEQSTCQLPEVLHHSILVEAVGMAKAVWNA